MKIPNLQSKNQQLKAGLTHLKTHQQNLETILSQITSAKAFKLWQGFNKAKKLTKQTIKSPKKILKALKIFFTQGPKGIIEKIKSQEIQNQQTLSINQQYQIWLRKHYPTKKDLIKQKLLSKKFKHRPKISIITPVYNPAEKFLRECIKSVINQTYDNWELCLVDDASPNKKIREIIKEYAKSDLRIKYKFRKKNGHICKASNDALKLATGEFIALLDHDDILWPNALYEVTKLLNTKPQADFIYSDEDKLDLDGTRLDPFFKPDWSPDMFLSTNYLCHLSVIRKKLVDQIGGFRPGYEGSQDYDLFLRVTEKTGKIYHIPDILYSWRKVPGSTAAVYEVKEYANEASLNALSDAIKRRKLKASVENGLVPGTFRVRYKILDSPLVSIIIPTKDKVNYLERCIESVLSKTDYENYEILVVDTGSKERRTLDYYRKLKKNKKIRLLNWNKPFNFAAVNNFAVKKAKGKYVLFLNNDTEVISSEWLSAMLEHAQREKVGAVGAKLLYPDNTIQHIGLILGKEIGATHYGIYHKDSTVMTFPFLNAKDIIRDTSAVTGACLLIKKSKYLRVAGLDNEFPIDYNDVDFCLKLLDKGLINVYTPFSVLRHHESISTGGPKKEEKERTWKTVLDAKKKFLQKWREAGEEDVYFNKNIFYVEKDLIALKSLFLTSTPAKKKILIISHLYWPAVGGAEKVFQKWAEILVSKNYDVVVFTTNALSTEDYYKDSLNTLPSKEYINNVEVIRFDISSRSHKIFKYLWKLVNKFSFTRNAIGPLFFGPHFLPVPKEVENQKYNYVVAGPSPTTTVFYGLILSKLKRIPFYLFSHLHINDKLHTALANRLLFKCADKIITTTSSEEKYFLSLGIPKNKIFKVFNPVDEMVIYKEKDNKSIIKTKSYILYLGQEGKHKNIPLLIDAMCHIWNLGYKNKLVIAGNRTDFSKEIDSLVNRINNEYKNCIIRMNNISDDEKINLLDYCLFLVNPSFHESFGLVFLEAWARKKAVIGNSITAVRDVVNDKKNGLIFKFNNENDLFYKMLALLTNPSKRKKMGLNGYNKLKNKFDFNSTKFDFIFS